MKETGTELILVDSDSDDNTYDIMVRFGESVGFKVIVLRAERKGLGFARKMASDKAAGDFLVYTDDDCYLEKGYLTKALDLFANGRFHYGGGRILLYDPSDAPFALKTRKEPYCISPGDYLPTGTIHGANMFFRRDALEKTGSFDERIGAGTKFRFEDIDLAARASFAGYTGVYLPQLVVFHHHGRKPGRELKKITAKNDFSRGAYFAKMIILGHRVYFKKWLGMWKKKKCMWTRLRELRGGLSYVFFNLIEK